MRAFNVYVRPLLEYAACVWSPHRASKIARIERVRRSFTNKLCGLADLSYKDRLSSLGAESLELRRVRPGPDARLYKIIFGHIDVGAESYFSFAYSGHDAREATAINYSGTIIARRCTEYTAQRIVPIWNSLAATAADFCNLRLRAFCSLIARLDFTKLE
jgi:hypothetical protein